MQRKMSKKKSSTFSDTFYEVPFEEIEHTADQALRIYGSNLEELLLHAARGINSLMVTMNIPHSVENKKSVELDTMDVESLLVEWLSELAYWAETEMLIFHKFDIHSVSPTHVKATLYGAGVEQLEKQIKAVTYHNLEVVRISDGFIATVVFDV